MTLFHRQINLITNAIVVATVLSLTACTEKEKAEERNKAEDISQVKTAVPIVSEDNIAKLQREAQEGDSDAQYNLAYMYENGLGVPKDESKALELYRQAADKGNPDAQTNLDAMNTPK